MPVAFVIGLAGLAYFMITPEIPFSITVQRIVAQTQSYTFLAVPFFIFAGNLMNESGITKRILNFASVLTRRMYGGLAQVSDAGAVEALARQAIEANPKPAAEFRAGKKASLQFLVGQVMKLSRGKANPKLAAEALAKLLA